MARSNITADITGTVWKIETQVGADLACDDPIMIVESMKMEIPIVAMDAGQVIEILVKEGDPVAEGQAVAIMEI